MKFVITAAADPNAKAREEGHPDQDLFAAYMKYNEELTKAGVLVASEGLNPDGKSVQIGVKDGKRVVLDGPFTETKELVGGFYIVDVKDRDEAIRWALKCPVGFDSAAVLTVHRLTGEGDIPPEYIEKIKQVAPTWWRSIDKKGGAR